MAQNRTGGNAVKSQKGGQAKASGGPSKNKFGGKKASGKAAGGRPAGSQSGGKPQQGKSKPAKKTGGRAAVTGAGSTEKQATIRFRFVTSAAEMKGCPQDTRPEVAVIGRSNAGKSSLLNGLARERVAMVSSTPGKTRLLNFYDAGPNYRFVDMPGYGFASRSGDEQRSWQKMIEPYLAARENLQGLVLVMDVRRDWTDDEQMLLDWLAPRQLPAVVVLTKMDKVSRSEFLQKQRRIREQSGVEHVFGTSSLKNAGFGELEDFVFLNWIKPVLRK